MKPMKYFALIALAGLVLAFSGCDLFTGIRGSGNLTSVASDLDSFTRVSVDAACEARIHYGAAFAIAVTLDDNLVPYLRIEKNGDELTVGLEPGRGYTDFTCVADITLPALAGVSAANASSAEISGFAAAGDLALSADNASALILDGIGAGNVTLTLENASEARGTVDCASFSASLADASTATLAGSSGALVLDAGNACTADLSGLPAADAAVQVRNASAARVRTAGALTGSVTSASSLRYAGNPASVSVNRDVSSIVSPL